MSGGGAEGRVDAPRVSVVVPVLNDAAPLSRLLTRFCSEAREHLEIIVVDGGSEDESAAVAEAAGCRMVSSRRGRGHQMAEGVSRARALWIWMLHADCEPSSEAVFHLIHRPAGEPAWGRFRVSLEPGAPLEVVAWFMNARSRLTGVCTGDQGIFVHRSLLERAGGVPRQSLMEDIELSSRLRRLCAPEHRPEIVGTSPRRWQRCGAIRTILSMWHFRLRYWLGADAERLAREYYGS